MSYLRGDPLWSGWVAFSLLIGLVGLHAPWLWCPVGLGFLALSVRGYRQWRGLRIARRADEKT